MQTKSKIFILALLLSACSPREEKGDAFGNFETIEIKVPSKANGVVNYLKVTEGRRYKDGELVGLIDTTQLYLKKKQLLAQQNIIRARKPSILAQIEVLKEQKANAEKELKRFKNLAETGAATQKQVDDLQDKVVVLEKQIDQVKTQNQPLMSELQSLSVQIEQVEQSIKDAHIYIPTNGKILLRLIEPGEMAMTGSPLFVIAETDTMLLRAYIAADQLDDIKIGNKAMVLFDDAKDKYHKTEGTITWISEEAEFTPTGIKTRSERLDQVYSVKLEVPNQEGKIKIGMPGQVIF